MTLSLQEPNHVFLVIWSNFEQKIFWFH